MSLLRFHLHDSSCLFRLLTLQCVSRGSLLSSQKTTEINEKLQEALRKLQLVTSVENERKRETKLKEVIASLQRIFPAGTVKGRVSDLCKPQERKYDTAISVVLGKNIDSIVVDSQQTALECVNVSRHHFHP